MEPVPFLYFKSKSRGNDNFDFEAKRESRTQKKSGSQDDAVVWCGVSRTTCSVGDSITLTLQA